jgi:hypothetical protein
LKHPRDFDPLSERTAIDSFSDVLGVKDKAQWKIWFLGTSPLGISAPIHAFLEGNYMDFGTSNRVAVTPIGTPCAVGCAFNAKATEATVLVGVNYRFW